MKLVLVNKAEPVVETEIGRAVVVRLPSLSTTLTVTMVVDPTRTNGSAALTSRWSGIPATNCSVRTVSLSGLAWEPGRFDEGVTITVSVLRSCTVNVTRPAASVVTTSVWVVNPAPVGVEYWK
jgi:hypothetical protein